jgi:hypothetical protein
LGTWGLQIVNTERSIMIKSNLLRIDVKAVVDRDGIGVILISAISEDGGEFSGLLSPEKTRELGNACFTEAEIADIDLILYEMLKNRLDLDDDDLSDFMSEFKKAREE